MWRLALLLAFGSGLCAAAKFELRGRIVPPSEASVSLFGATTPFHAATTAGSSGRFRFRDLDAGEYTLAVLVAGIGEQRRTIEVGSATADRRDRIEITIHLEDSSRVSGEALRGNGAVSARALSIPQSARREYAEAQKKLARRETESAVAHLQKAVALAPQYAEAWNNLGTIAYQTRQYAQAESDFLKALEAEPDSFEPLVNLGGTLLSEGQAQKALPYNRRAVLARPNDALANSQLGMDYFVLGDLDLGEKYLIAAKRIDPAHFSYPQLTLAEIYLRRNQPLKAAAEWREFLCLHPDAPAAAGVRSRLAAIIGRQD